MQIGEHFAYLYQRTAETAPADQIIHLCYLDRLSFALEGEYRKSFLEDIDSLSANDLPLIFQRSPLAWDTHPQISMLPPPALARCVRQDWCG